MLFREVNQAVQVYFRVGDQTEAQFVCECSDPSCVEKVRLTRGQYLEIRDHPTRFFVLPGHEFEVVDRVIDERSGFTIVEKPLVP